MAERTGERVALENRVREERQRRGWSQDDLARRAGLSRAGVSAIETGRLVPSAAAALALGAAFGCRVEDLFMLPKPSAGPLGWAWPPASPGGPGRFWRAEVGGVERLYPVEPGPLGVTPHDGMAGAAAESGGVALRADAPEASKTLVIACCDPAVGLLAAELERAEGVRLVALPRSSRQALDLLGRGLVHAAGVHLSRSGDAEGNAGAVLTLLGQGYSLARSARWEEGVALGPGLPARSLSDVVRSDLRWVGREPGSGARQCLDELLEGREPPRHLARDHRGVAEAVRSGWAEAGVCLRLTGEEAGLTFLSFREEAYDLCFPDALRDDPRLEALVRVLQSNRYRRLIAELPGYSSAETGEVRKVR